jgi:MoaA/NifB/PqqE/SkfB family radical SAM enzyme
MIKCLALDHGILIDKFGYFRPCCNFGKKRLFNINENSIEDFRNSQFLSSVKNKMNSGEWDYNCDRCQMNEADGGSSLRKYMDDLCEGTGQGIRYLEIHGSITCDSRCRMCSSDYSSRWAVTEGIELQKSIDINQIIDIIKNENLHTIKYLGGEPFFTPQIVDLLKFLAESKNPINFGFHTNVNVFPKKYLSYLDKIDVLIPGFSIDGFGPVNDYIRQDSSWDTVFSNLNLWLDYLEKHNLKSRENAYFHTVLQAYNYHDIHRINEYCKKVGIYHSILQLSNPACFRLNALPPQYIDQYKNDFNLKYLNNYKFDESLFDLLKKKTLELDLLFDKKIENYIPELYSYF